MGQVCMNAASVVLACTNKHVLGAPAVLCAGLRAEDEQAVLASLAACPNVHLVASCDHVNSVDLW